MERAEGEGGRGGYRRKGREGEKGEKEGRRSASGSFNFDLIRKKLLREWHWPLNFLHSVQKCNMK
jgi:hypothetical protein